MSSLLMSVGVYDADLSLLVSDVRAFEVVAGGAVSCVSCLVVSDLVVSDLFVSDLVVSDFFLPGGGGGFGK